MPRVRLVGEMTTRTVGHDVPTPKPFTSDRSEVLQATEKARELEPEAFAVWADLAPKEERCQIRMLERRFDVEHGVLHEQQCLIAAGPTWTEALSDLWAWVQERRDEEGAH
jgi:hypothetical protein